MKCIDKYLYIQIGAFIYWNFSSLRNFRKMVSISLQISIINLLLFWELFKLA